MADLWIGNVEADTSEVELQEFLGRYGFPAFDGIQYFPGTGARPAVLLTFGKVEAEALRMLQPRVDNLFWKNRRITVQVMPSGRDET